MRHLRFITIFVFSALVVGCGAPRVERRPPPVPAPALPAGASFKTAPPADAHGTLELLFVDPRRALAPTPHCDSPACRGLLGIIDGAETCLDLAWYGVRNQPVILKAIRAARARGVRVRAVVDRDQQGGNVYRDTDAFTQMVRQVRSDQQSDRDRVQRAATKSDRDTPDACRRPPGFKGPLQCLSYDLGDRCLVAGHASREPFDSLSAIMHHKFAIADKAVVWTGSTNISDSGTGGYNANLSVLLRSPLIAQWYTREFEQMYVHGRYHEDKLQHRGWRAKLSDDVAVEVFFSPQSDTIERQLRPLIQRAQRRVDVMVFFLTHKRLTADFIAAHRRGVKVRVLIDAVGAKNGYSKHTLLRAAGIPVKIEDWGGKMHMKAAVIDRRIVVAGSMNWTRAGHATNDENTLIIHSPADAAEVEDFMDLLWDDVHARWLDDRPDPESRQSAQSCHDGSDNDHDGLVDVDDPGCGDDPPILPALPSYEFTPKTGEYCSEADAFEARRALW